MVWDINGEAQDRIMFSGIPRVEFIIGNCNVSYLARYTDSAILIRKSITSYWLSNQQINSDDYVPTSGLVYSMNQTLTSLNDAWNGRHMSAIYCVSEMDDYDHDRISKTETMLLRVQSQRTFSAGDQVVFIRYACGWISTIICQFYSASLIGAIEFGYGDTFWYHSFASNQWTHINMIDNL